MQRGFILLLVLSLYVKYIAWQFEIDGRIELIDYLRSLKKKGQLNRRNGECSSFFFNLAIYHTELHTSAVEKRI